jgi:lipopolysaccharide transport protein LptA
MKHFSLFILCVSFALSGLAQITAGTDSTKPIQIIRGKRLEYRKIDTLNSLQILAGNVILKQGTTLFYCDSCVINNQTKIFEAFGHVHINDSDTTNVYSNYLRYLSTTRMAYLNGNVKLTDKHSTLTTNELEYDVARKIGTYKNGGKVINRKSVLTSTEGVYYADVKDVYFKQNVILKDPAYTLKSDSLLYNTETQIARFISETHIKDSSGRTIITKEGFYDTKASRAEFTSRTTIQDKSLTVSGDQIASDDATGIVQIRGRGVMRDTAQGIAILANEIFVDKKKDALLATHKPLMILKQEKDSIYITGDTLFSARLSDRFKKIDTATKKIITIKAKGKKPVNDSTDRYFEAFRHVRIFSDSVQAVCDSLFYSYKDSVFRLFQNPVVWGNKSQITGDTIYLYTRRKKADRLEVYENSFLVNSLDPGVYNQIKATRMDGWFKEGALDSLRARGSAETVYFLRNEDSAYTGANQTTSDLMDAYFRKSELNKVVFRSNVKGTLWPIKQKSPSQLQLPGFLWLEDKRPKTKYELFE